MVCPRCGHLNSDGRKYCRGCAKSLAAEPARIPPPEAPRPAYLHRPALSKMALASLLLSIFTIIVPLGIAAVVLGHISRVQIARSGGREKGLGVALAGLAIGYLQLALVVLVALGLLGVWPEFRPEVDRKPYNRAAILDRIAHGDPNKVTPDNTARHQQKALAALRIIHAEQANYLAAHPGDGYACQLSLLGVDSRAESELGSLLAVSDYDVKILRCSQVDGPNYVVLAIPRTEGNPGDAPIYCLDQANGIERYDADQARDAVPAVVTRVTQPCPQTGTHVD
jgi:hypothetical protein